jgi:condensin complex subunit 2
MSLLKEGDGVNFQRASCTLDGCVKIYTNRVDSVATETGKLLSGLADSNSDKRKGDNEDEEGEDEDGEGEDGEPKKRKKKTQRTAEATLATSFSQLQLKKMELEFAVDPLFKKASADFDEGGAKGLLLNHLAIDATGRIVFDSSEDAHEVDDEDEDREEQDAKEGVVDGDQTHIPAQSSTEDIDMDALASKYFPDLGLLDGLDICPSLKTFELGEADGSLDLPFLKANNDWSEDKQGNTGTEQDNADDGLGGAFDDDDNLGGGFELPDEIGFGEGGEAWAKEAALGRPLGVHVLQTVEGEEGAEGMDGEDALDSNDRYGISMKLGDGNEQQNILDYFDKALQKNWAGPEHWKIRRVKDAAKSATVGPTKRKEREPFEIDFAAPMSQALADALYTPVASNSAISLPRAQWRSKTRNLLPDDKHFSSRQLLRLFLKPKAILGRRQSGRRMQTIAQPPNGEVDEQYWAQQEGANAHGEDDVAGNYDANFFQDDGFGGLPDVDENDDFADARDHFSPQAENGVSADGAIPDGPFGAQLVTQSRRFRPEYVQYARVATKVDVRRLKEEIWRGLAIDEVSEIEHECQHRY